MDYRSIVSDLDIFYIYFNLIQYNYSKDSEESDRQEVRVSMGWKVKKDASTGNSVWQISERKNLDSKLSIHKLIFKKNFIENRRKEIRNMTMEQALLQRSNLCLEEKKIWI